MTADYLPNIHDDSSVYEESAKYCDCVDRGYTLWNKVAVVDVGFE